MGRMIDTDAAYAVLTDYYHHSTDPQHAALREALGRVETVDAVPVRHGRWIKKRYWSEGVGMGERYGYYYSCSKCGNLVCGGYDECGKKYCDECGARMDGEDGDHAEGTV